MRDGCCCCIKLPPEYTESQCGRRDRIKEFFGSIYAKAILSLPGKVIKSLRCINRPLTLNSKLRWLVFHFFFQIIVMVITGVLFGFSLYGTLQLRQYFDQVWFFPPESMSYKYITTNDKVSLFVGVTGRVTSI